MKTLPAFATVLLCVPLSACAARTAPFNQLDQAQVTVMRLAAPQPAVPPTLLPGLPIPPELQKMGQQALQGLQTMLPGLQIPGATPGSPGAPGTQQLKGYAIVSQMPLLDDGVKEEVLDIFGQERSFSPQIGNCFNPGWAFVMQRPNAPEIDLFISLACNQAHMDGAPWPYPVYGLAPPTRDHLARIYERLFGPPVPPTA